MGGWGYEWGSFHSLGTVPAGWSGTGGGSSQPSLKPPSFQSFNAYFSNEHSRLLLLWRQVVGVRRLVSEVKMSTER